jgi:ubiquinone/menaquinone biosynthesis C-methylase UbiE
VGGGNGQLASFLDDTFKYCLAEPQHNGLDGRTLPFKENSFDYVVASHVFEHIPQKDRELFVNNMLKIASKGIILVNPFHIEGTFEKERMELALKIINQKWIQEHLDCGLPNLEELKDFANKHKKNIEITPNGSGMTAMAYMYLAHYANKAGKRKEYKEINKFYNQNYFNFSTNDKFPVEYIIYIN